MTPLLAAILAAWIMFPAGFVFGCFWAGRERMDDE